MPPAAPAASLTGTSGAAEAPASAESEVVPVEPPSLAGGDGSGGAMATDAGTAKTANGSRGGAMTTDAGGEIGAAGAAGFGGQPATGPAENECDTSSFSLPSAFDQVYRIPLLVHTTRSQLEREDLCQILAEVNQIWLSQAGVCFEMEITKTDEPRDFGMDIWWEVSAPFPNGVEANGVYGGAHEIYTLDRPSLGNAPNPTEARSARTAAHELGHALNLRHQNCGAACQDLLMTSGRRGFALAMAEPADTNEVDRARAAAAGMRRGQTLALPETDLPQCARPRFVD